MNDFVLVEKSNLNDTETLQIAIKKAVKDELFTVVVKGGSWKIDKTLLIPEYLHFIIDGAKIEYVGEGFFMANSNSATTYKNVIAAEQKAITISGKNDAEIIGGTIFLNNVRNCAVEGLTFTKADFGVVLTSTIGVKLKRLNFNGCKVGVALGTGASDITINSINGTIEEQLICIDNKLFNQYKKLYHPTAVKNVIVRAVSAKAERIVKITGDAEKLIFTSVKGKALCEVFRIDGGKHVVIQNVSAEGKIIDGEFDKNHVIIN